MCTNAISTGVGARCVQASLVHKVQPSSANVKNTVLIWDTGASFGLTPFRSDFIDYVKCDIQVKDVTKVNTLVSRRERTGCLSPLRVLPYLTTNNDRRVSLLSTDVSPAAWWQVCC